MKISEDNLKEILIKPGHVSEEQFSSALSESKKSGKSIWHVLVENEYVRDEQLGKIVADFLGFKFVNLKKEGINESVVRTIPELVARHKEFIAYNSDGNSIKVGMVDPGDIEAIHFIQKRTLQKVLPYMITEFDFANSILVYKAGIKEEFDNILKKFSSYDVSVPEQDDLTIKMVNMIFQYAYQNKASDVHIEPYKDVINIRFRIDGIMHDVLSIPKKFGDPILMRIKILSKMRTDEHMAAQDGKLKFLSEDTSDSLGEDFSQEEVDVRVSVVPVTEGENVVMRLLTSKNRRFSLDDIGLGKEDSEKLSKSIKNPHGMILVTGPTGSGKTTTLYAVLKILNKREVHISTIEDPVEYDIEGVSQIQVNEKTGLTFASGLRSIVRQDPDIIMVGEIRDEETADIAVNSALTGHLVLSTLHTNDAVTTLPRLLDMQIEPFLVASTVNIVVAQRLVRKICEKCRASSELSGEEKTIIKNDEHIKGIFSKMGYDDVDGMLVFKGAGCKVCANTGYSGRLGIFEVLEMSDNVKSLILKRVPSNELLEEAVKEGMTTMMEDGFKKVLSGDTTFSEVLRVAME